MNRHRGVATSLAKTQGHVFIYYYTRVMDRQNMLLLLLLYHCCFKSLKNQRLAWIRALSLWCSRVRTTQAHALKERLGTSRIFCIYTMSRDFPYNAGLPKSYLKNIKKDDTRGFTVSVLGKKGTVHSVDNAPTVCLLSSYACVCVCVFVSIQYPLYVLLSKNFSRHFGTTANWALY